MTLGLKVSEPGKADSGTAYVNTPGSPARYDPIK